MSEYAHSDLVYIRGERPDGAVFYAMQCKSCLNLVRTKKHNGKLLLKHYEIPCGETIHAYKGGGSNV